MDKWLVTGACTLPTVEQPVRLAEFDQLFGDAVRRVERLDGTVRLHLVGDPGLRDRVRDLVDRESQCCSFFSFDIAGTDRELDLVVSVPPERAALLAELAARAESCTP
jgi:hypothetical protein